MSPPWDQGDKNLAISLARAMPGFQFRTITSRNAPLLEEPNLEAVPLYSSLLPGLREKFTVLAWLAAQINFARTHRTSLYHFIFQPSRFSSQMLKMVPGINSIPSVHTITASANGVVLTKELFFTRRIVTLSENGRRTLQQAGLTNVSRIYPGIHIDDWACLAGKETSYKAGLGLAGHPVILFPGHYGLNQGADVLAKALPRLLDRMPEARVIFACRLRSSSDIDQENQIKSAVQMGGLESAIRFYNTVTDMRALIGAADITVLPLGSMRNKIDLPTTLIETLAASKPIVISDLAPMNELVNGYMESDGHLPSRSGEFGLTVPPGDAEALADAMLDLLLHPVQRVHMGIHGQRFVRQHFDICDVAKQYERIYLDLL